MDTPHLTGTTKGPEPVNNSRGRPPNPALNSRFIDAALALLAEGGYSSVTTAAVAKRAGASTASLYRRWPTKKALVADIARTLTLDGIGVIDTGDLVGDLRELAARKQRLLKRVGAALCAFLAEAGHEENIRSILQSEVIDSIENRLLVIVRSAVLRGEIPCPSQDTVRMLSLLIIGGGLMSSVMTQTEAFDDREGPVHTEVHLLLRALGATESKG